MTVLSAQSTRTHHNVPTTSFTLALAADPSRTLKLELSESFDFNKPELLPEITEHLREEAIRLRNPIPASAVTLAGLPIIMKDFAWPFHRSTTGSDTFIVHGVIDLADGTDSALHAKISASMTLTFAEIVPAPEQPYAESFIYNAIRKTLDQGQLEMLKSGNRQPVPVTTRYYSRWQKAFLFTSTTPEERADFLALKLFWLSGILGKNLPVWVIDPRDAQYLNTTEEELRKAAQTLVQQGLAIAATNDFCAATPALLTRRDFYEHKMHAALDFTKPTFNEDMRGGHTNM
jgi:hypothetical protein